MGTQSILNYAFLTGKGFMLSNTNICTNNTFDNNPNRPIQDAQACRKFNQRRFRSHVDPLQLPPLGRSASALTPFLPLFLVRLLTADPPVLLRGMR